MFNPVLDWQNFPEIDSVLWWALVKTNGIAVYVGVQDNRGHMVHVHKLGPFPDLSDGAQHKVVDALKKLDPSGRVIEIFTLELLHEINYLSRRARTHWSRIASLTQLLEEMRNWKACAADGPAATTTSNPDSTRLRTGMAFVFQTSAGD